MTNSWRNLERFWLGSPTRCHVKSLSVQKLYLLLELPISEMKGDSKNRGKCLHRCASGQGLTRKGESTRECKGVSPRPGGIPESSLGRGTAPRHPPRPEQRAAPPRPAMTQSPMCPLTICPKHVPDAPATEGILKGMLDSLSRRKTKSFVTREGRLGNTIPFEQTEEFFWSERC